MPNKITTKGICMSMPEKKSESIHEDHNEHLGLVGFAGGDGHVDRDFHGNSTRRGTFTSLQRRQLQVSARQCLSADGDW
jgi:hypothetical protein